MAPTNGVVALTPPFLDGWGVKKRVICESPNMAHVRKRPKIISRRWNLRFGREIMTLFKSFYLSLSSISPNSRLQNRNYLRLTLSFLFFLHHSPHSPPPSIIKQASMIEKPSLTSVDATPLCILTLPSKPILPSQNPNHVHRG